MRSMREVLGALTASVALVAMAPSAAASSAPPPSLAALPRPKAIPIGCSLTEPVCVHAIAGAAIDSAVAAQVMTNAERSIRTLRALSLPMPLPDGSLGGGAEFDLYLGGGTSGARAHGDPASVFGSHPRGTAFATLDTGHTGCELASDVVRALVQGALLSLDPGVHESTRAIGSSQLAALAAPCPTVEAAAVDRFQRRPELAVTRAPVDRFVGGFLWADYLDQQHGRGTPGRLWLDLVALGGGRPMPDAVAWSGEPDVYDVLRRLLAAIGTSLDDAQLGFAIARAFVGTRSDGAHLLDVERFADLGPVGVGWSVTLDGLPRRLRTPAIEATGATYVWIDATRAAAGDGLSVVAECEHAHAFRWAIVTLDADGRERGRHVGGRWGEPVTTLSLASLEGVSSVLIVGAAGGHDDRDHPFDPEEPSFHEAACEITLRVDRTP